MQIAFPTEMCYAAEMNIQVSTTETLVMALIVHIFFNKNIGKLNKIPKFKISSKALELLPRSAKFYIDTT